MFKKLVQMGIQKLSGQGKTTGTEIIKNVKIAPNIDTKKAIEQKVVKTVDQAFKDADPQGVYTQTLASKKKKSKLKKDESKKLKDVSYKLDKLEEKVKKRNEGSSKLFKAFKGRKFNKGGRVGLKFGSKKKSNIQKIQETFGPKKKVPNKFKGFSKLPEKVQQKIDAKLAKKV